MRCQGVEMHVVPAARQLLVEKVHRLHIGTHHITIHQAIREVLREDNWLALESHACVPDAGSSASVCVPATALWPPGFLP